MDDFIIIKRDFLLHIVHHTVFIKVFIVFCLFNVILLLVTKDPRTWKLSENFATDQEKKLFQCSRSINNSIALFQVNLWLTLKS